MPKIAADRRLLTTTKLASEAIADELEALEQVAARDGTDYWHVRILDWQSDAARATAAATKRTPSSRRRRTRDGPPMIAVEFIIGRHDRGYSILKWSISGYQMVSTRASRFPLQTYAKA